MLERFDDLSMTIDGSLVPDLFADLFLFRD